MQQKRVTKHPELFWTLELRRCKDISLQFWTSYISIHTKTMPRVAAALMLAVSAAAFTLPARHRATALRPRAADDDAAADAAPAAAAADDDASVAASLEAKLKSFEATEEEQRAATLGGLIPGSSGADAFDVSLYLAAIPLFGSLALFLFFPLLAPKLAESGLLGSDIPPPGAF